jgi:membrane-bound lytic murein transglycosylase A
MLARLALVSLAGLAVASCVTRPAPAPTPSPPAPAPVRPAAAAPMAEVVLAFGRTDFGALAGWSDLDFAAARMAFQRSCIRVTARPDDTPLSGAAPYAGRVRDWLAACSAARDASLDARAFFERSFTPWSVAPSDGAPGKLTAYYEPELAVATAPTGPLTEPLLPRPADLVQVNLADFDVALGARSLSGRVRDGRLQPYASRTEIMAAPGPALAYGHPTDVFFLQVQGSGRIRFPDGLVQRAVFAGHNGQPYRSIGAVLIERGALTRDNASAGAIKTWMDQAGPAAARELTNQNPRYVFFNLEPLGDPTEGPKGAQGSPLTGGASLAIDPGHHPYGVPVMIDARAPVLTDAMSSIRRLVVTQDTGGAIRGPLRGDLFWGSGDEAGRNAGRVNHEVRWWVLLPNGLDPVAVGAAAAGG